MEKRGKGNGTCCVKSCKNIRRSTSREIQFYSFPTASYKAEQKKLWINWVRKTNTSNNWEPAKHSLICSAHFVGNKSSLIPLSPSYVPSISGKKGPGLSSHEKGAIQRFNRSMRRRQSVGEKKNLTRVGTEENSSEPNLQEPLHHPDQPIEFPTALLTVDQGIQVEMFGLTPEHRQLYEGTKTFICTQYVHNDICHAQTQVFIPETNEISLTIIKKRDTKDKCCGPCIVQVDKVIGPDDRDSIIEGVCTSGFHGMASITKDQEMLDLCGVTIPTYKLLLNSLPGNKVKKIGKENRLLIFLMKLKSGMSFSAIGVLFRVHRTTASRIFFSVLQVLRVACSKFITWPCRDVIQSTMPEVFKSLYGNTRVIIDCTEIRVEQPNTVENRVYLYSHYKKGFTAKVLVGCTPCGFISFISKCYGGRTSDCQLTIDSGILNLLQPHDVVLADKGFPGIQTVLDENGKGALIVMPPFLYNGQFSAEDVEKTYEIAKVRIHIERIMQRLRIYKILDKFSIDMLPHADDIVFVCAALVNLQPPIIKDGDVDETDLKQTD